MWTWAGVKFNKGQCNNSRFPEGFFYTERFLRKVTIAIASFLALLDTSLPGCIDHLVCKGHLWYSLVLYKSEKNRITEISKLMDIKTNRSEPFIWAYLRPQISWSSWWLEQIQWTKLRTPFRCITALPGPTMKVTEGSWSANMPNGKTGTVKPRGSDSLCFYVLNIESNLGSKMLLL